MRRSAVLCLSIQLVFPGNLFVQRRQRRGKKRFKTLAPDLLLLLADDVHGHEHVEGVVDATPDVLLVVLTSTLRNFFLRR
jgi:hypothetical protein